MPALYQSQAEQWMVIRFGVTLLRTYDEIDSEYDEEDETIIWLELYWKYKTLFQWSL
jgi:hypothetical protein